MTTKPNLPTTLDEGETYEDAEVFDRRSLKATARRQVSVQQPTTTTTERMNKKDKVDKTEDDELLGDDENKPLRSGPRSYGNARENTEGFYNAGSDNCTAEVGCERGIGIFSDAFYAQVLAYSVGLGDLLARPERLDQHLQYVAKKNCIHNDMTKPSTPLVSGCPNGLVTMTGRLTEQTDLSVWEMATFDHAALMLRRATSSAEADASLALAEGTGTSYAKRINDQWNTAGVKFNDGNPSVTSHYGYHMTSWHLLLGLSGQLADFSDEHNASLTFAPPAMDCGFSYPVLLPGAVGSIRCEVVRRTKMGKEAGKAEEEKRTFTLVFCDA